MTDDQWFRIGLSILFNGPIVLLSAVYARNMRRDHKAQKRDLPARRAYLVSIALLAAIGAYMTLAVGLIVVDAPPIPRELRSVIFALRVVIFGILLVVVRSYRRQNRVLRERR